MRTEESVAEPKDKEETDEGFSKLFKTEQSEETESQSFSMKKLFFPNTAAKRLDTGSTRPQTSASKSLRYSKLVETPTNKTAKTSENIMQRPNSAFIKFYDKSIKEELEKTAYLMSELENEKNPRKEKNVQSAKSEKEEGLFIIFSGTERKRKEANDVFESYPLLKCKIQKSILKDLNNY